MSDPTVQRYIDAFTREMEKRKEVSQTLIRALALHRMVQDLDRASRPVAPPLPLVERVVRGVIRVLSPTRMRTESHRGGPRDEVVVDAIYVVSEDTEVEHAADEATQKEKWIWRV